MRATSKTDATQWNLLIQNLTTLDSIWKGSSSVRYLSTAQCQSPVSKVVEHWAILGLYSGIFAMYLQHCGSQQSTDRANSKNILFYALWGLYALTAATIIIEMLQFCWNDSVSMDDYHCSTSLLQLILQNVEILYHLEIIEITLFGFCDVIAQSILVRQLAMAIIIHLIVQKIYRCWIVWGYNIRVVIIPAFLAFAFLGTLIILHSLSDFNLWFIAIWIASGTAPLSILQGQFNIPEWGNTLTVAGLALSMTVNALVTGLIAFRIFRVFQEVKNATAEDQILGVTGGSTLWRVIFIIIESGMILFSTQLTRLVVAKANTDAANDAYALITGIHEMLNVIMMINHCYVILLIT